MEDHPMKNYLLTQIIKIGTSLIENFPKFRVFTPGFRGKICLLVYFDYRKIIENTIIFKLSDFLETGQI